MTPQPKKPTARATRTLSIQQLPADIKRLIKNKRELHETWQETIIRILRSKK